MIYFVCPNVARPSGGVRAIYRSVDLLNSAKQPAAVLHSANGFRCTWFENDTPVAYTPVHVGAADVLVFPGDLLSHAPAAAPGIRKVIFNQNAYRTFRAAPGQSGPMASRLMRAPDIVGVLVVSDDSRRYLEHAFPDVPVSRLHHCIDSGFFYLDTAARRRKITTMPRKSPDDFAQISAILGARHALRGWELEILEERSEREVARKLRQSVLFMSFARAEGFGLPAAEAIASGCHVIGYHGMAGREFFQEPFATAIEQGDTHAFASAVERFVTTYDERSGALAREAEEGSAFIHAKYSRERATADLAGFFAPLTGGCGPPASAVVTRGDLRHEPRLIGAVRRRLMPIGRKVMTTQLPTYGSAGRRRR